MRGSLGRMRPRCPYAQPGDALMEPGEGHQTRYQDPTVVFSLQELAFHAPGAAFMASRSGVGSLMGL